MTKLREQFSIRNRKKLGAASAIVLVTIIVVPITLIRSQITVTQPPITISQPTITMSQPFVTMSQPTVTIFPDPSITSVLYPWSVFAPVAPKIDGIISSEEWGAARKMHIDNGWLLYQNDATTLYLVIDLTEDTTNDPPLANAPWGDYFYLGFDVLADEKIIPYKDLQYGIYPGTHKLGMQKYTSSTTWTGLMDTYSQLGAGFGTSMNSEISHRIWELAISLPEIQIGPGGRVRLGVRTHSQNPSFTNDTPQGFTTDFSDLIEIMLVNARVDLLILAHEDFCDALKPLKTHKESTGLSTYIQSWQNINRSFGSQGRDEAERVKKTISFYEKYCDTQYVMLVGDSDKFPVRYTMTDRATPEAFDRAFYPTDLYYADLYKADGSFDTWDSNNNGYYGELHGETLTGTINFDQVNLIPDIAVGRVPASSNAEVSKYVNKVINYEFGAYQADWFKKALLIATTNWFTEEAACQHSEDIAASLPGYTIIKQYQSGNPCVATPNVPNPTNIKNVLDNGVGFVSYIGHGGPNEWQIPDNYYMNIHLPALNNADKLPIVFAAACSTSYYAVLPPYDGYRDINGQSHQGTNSGQETFTNIPPQPACIQTANPDCFGETILVKYETGAIAYMGCATGAQPIAMKLDQYFFETVTSTSPATLGLMWNAMITKFYQQENIPTSLSEPDWLVVASFHHPWKYQLFGDPSLRVGGIMQPIVMTAMTQVTALPALTPPKIPVTYINPVPTILPVTSPGIPIKPIAIKLVTTSGATVTPPDTSMPLISQPVTTQLTEVSTVTSETQSPVTITSDPTETSETHPARTITSVTTETSTMPTIPGFRIFEVLLAIFGLSGYAHRRSKIKKNSG